jgi:hypothetical protein
MLGASSPQLPIAIPCSQDTLGLLTGAGANLHELSFFCILLTAVIQLYGQSSFNSWKIKSLHHLMAERLSE